LFTLKTKHFEPPFVIVIAIIKLCKSHCPKYFLENPKKIGFTKPAFSLLMAILR